MSQLLGIKFNDYGQLYYFSSGAFVVAQGQSVLVKTEQGMGLGKVVLVKNSPEDEDQAARHETIYRLANEKDFESQAENHDLSRAAFEFCRKCIIDHKLEMKLVDVEVFFDRSKMVFYFTAPGRIDFRELIKDLVKEYRTRIELRQIGVRHETQMLGALGNCGQICCCRRFLRKFVPVTIKMAKEQNLFLNPSKISGICGRLLCCLSYEQEGYEEFNRLCPKVGKRYNTTRGPVKVLRSNFFRKTLTILPESGPEEDIPLEDWQEMRKPGPPGRGQAPNQSPGQSSGQAPSQPKNEGRRRDSRPAKQDSGPGKQDARNQADTPESAQDTRPEQARPEHKGSSARGDKPGKGDKSGKEPARGSIFGLNDPVEPDESEAQSGSDSNADPQARSGGKPSDGKQPPKGAKGSGRKPNKRRRKRGRPPKRSDSSS